ncbi:MAG: hypothetical protein HRU26_07055, partial [Psychroserpens sp.]|nr:hypothetical protein [Psychroserpens sp.]
MEEPREQDFYMEEWTEVKDGKKSVPLNHVEYESALRMYIKHLQSQLKNHVSEWVQVAEKLPDHQQTVWLSNDKGCTTLGCRV